MKKKLVPSIAILFVVMSVVFLVVLNWQGLVAIFNGAKVYTAEQVKESYNQGRTDAKTNEKLYLDQIEKLQGVNDGLATENKKLQYNIDYYKDFIANLENDHIAVVTLEIDGVLYDLCAAEKGTTLASALSGVVEPTKVGYNFMGWSDGVNTVDIATTVTKNMTLTAVFEIKTFDVQFVMSKAKLYGDETLEGDVTLYSLANVPYGYSFSQAEIDEIDAAVKSYQPKWSVSWKDSATDENLVWKEYQIKAETIFIPSIITENAGNTSGGGVIPFDPTTGSSGGH